MCNLTWSSCRSVLVYALRIVDKDSSWNWQYLTFTCIRFCTRATVTPTDDIKRLEIREKKTVCEQSNGQESHNIWIAVGSANSYRSLYTETGAASVNNATRLKSANYYRVSHKRRREMSDNKRMLPGVHNTRQTLSTPANASTFTKQCNEHEPMGQIHHPKGMIIHDTKTTLMIATTSISFRTWNQQIDKIQACSFTHQGPAKRENSTLMRFSTAVRHSASSIRRICRPMHSLVINKTRRQQSSRLFAARLRGMASKFTKFVFGSQDVDSGTLKM